VKKKKKKKKGKEEEGIGTLSFERFLRCGLPTVAILEVAVVGLR